MIETFGDVPIGQTVQVALADGPLTVERLYTMPRQVWVFDEQARRWKRPFRMTNAIDSDGMYYMIDFEMPLYEPLTDDEALRVVRRVAGLDGE